MENMKVSAIVQALRCSSWHWNMSITSQRKHDVNLTSFSMLCMILCVSWRTPIGRAWVAVLRWWWVSFNLWVSSLRSASFSNLAFLGPPSCCTLSTTSLIASYDSYEICNDSYGVRWWSQIFKELDDKLSCLLCSQSIQLHAEPHWRHLPPFSDVQINHLGVSVPGSM